MKNKLYNYIIVIKDKILSLFYHYKKPYIEIGKYGIRYLIDPRSALDYHIIKHGILNDLIATHLSEFIEEDSVLFDIGANVGLLSLPFAKKHIKKGRIFSYEPDKDNFSKLKINIELNRQENIFINKVALQDKEEVSELSFFIRRSIDGEGNNNFGLSSLGNPGLHTRNKVKVIASTLNKEVSKYNLNRIDFIKIDVEGFEYEVLKGGEKSIIKYKPIIQYEFSPILDKLLKKENCLNCFNFMKKINYVQYRIVDEKYLKVFKQFDNNIDDCNVLCFDSENIPKVLNNFIK